METACVEYLMCLSDGKIVILIKKNPKIPTQLFLIRPSFISFGALESQKLIQASKG